LQDLQEAHGFAYLFVSHDLAVVEHMSHWVLVMRKGEIVEQGSVAEVYGAPKHPYTRELLDAVPRLPVRANAAGAATGDVGNAAGTRVSAAGSAGAGSFANRSLAMILCCLLCFLWGGCFTGGDFGGWRSKDPHADPLTLSHIIGFDIEFDAVFGNEPLRDFVFRGKSSGGFPFGAGESVFVLIPYEEVFDAWEVERKPLADPFSVNLWYDNEYKFLKELPAGFVPLSGDYAFEKVVAGRARTVRAQLHTGFDWARFGRYWYQVPLDLVTSPFQLGTYLFLGTVFCYYSVRDFFTDAKPPPKVVRPKSWSREHIRQAVAEYEKAFSEWRERNEASAAHATPVPAPVTK